MLRQAPLPFGGSGQAPDIMVRASSCATTRDPRNPVPPVTPMVMTPFIRRNRAAAIRRRVRPAARLEYRIHDSRRPKCIGMRHRHRSVAGDRGVETLQQHVHSFEVMEVGPPELHETAREMALRLEKRRQANSILPRAPGSDAALSTETLRASRSTSSVHRVP